MSKQKPKSPLYIAGLVIAAIVIAVLRQFGGLPPATPTATSSSTTLTPPAQTATRTASTPTPPSKPTASERRSTVATGSSDAGEQTILRAYRNQQSDLIVEATGTIKKILPDDNDGSRHQRLIVRLKSGHTVLIAHNIDLAPRAPAREGDTITFRGEYEYSDEGGVIHWTHHDPGGRHPGGWLKIDGKRYE